MTDKTDNPSPLVFAADQAGERIDRFLARQFLGREGEALSRTRIKALIEEGQALLDGMPVLDAGHTLKAGQSVRLAVPPPVAAEPLGEDIPLVILYEDADLLVIDKPVGLVVHPAAGHQTGTLVNALIAHCGDSLSGVGGVRRPGIVHRLDKDTSGLLVVAKNDRAHQGLAAQFADHGRTGPLERAYLAFVWGGVRDHGTVETGIDRSIRNREKMQAVPPGRGREAITHYARLEIFGDRAGAPLVSLVECRLETGRTHQIRVHMTHLGHPLLGDAVYGGGFKTKAALLSPAARPVLEGLGRQALHARLLGFEHPVTGEHLVFESELPADLAQLADALRRGWE
ncbi:RluA family pseudouridine synthase [Labrys monachus]|uniref:Pseudouridine synthase n=1 Tax=Labrys monachus TaxID=217067 RepID=A0ABU0F885_9HYPH|nr:RluA family pseudouridine synthase [Labrys monachus]MDQ0390814.1 23S rRNA pseudouridine1911/1915/1917 synthase [Labrys monachus]